MSATTGSGTRQWYPVSKLSGSITKSADEISATNRVFVKKFGGALIASLISLRSQLEFNRVFDSSAAPAITEAIYRIPAARYHSLARTIDSFSRLNEDEPLYVDPSSAQAAKAFVDLMKGYNVSLPKVFSHSGDAVVFTWELLNSQRYITTSENTAAFQEVSKNGSYIEDIKVFDLTNQQDVASIISILGASQWQKQSNW